MPYDKSRRGNKGKTRRFTSPDELEAQNKEYREKKREETDESSSEESSDEEQVRTNNPNVQQTRNKKLNSLTDTQQMQQGGQPLSRRQREEIQKAEAQRRYRQLHAQGKTDEARADLARLAIIRKEREAAAARKKVEKEEAEKKAKARKEASLNAIKSGPGARRARNKKK